MNRSYKMYTLTYELSGENVFLASPVRYSKNMTVYISRMESHAFRTLNKRTIERNARKLISYGYAGVTILTETKVKR